MAGVFVWRVIMYSRSTLRPANRVPGTSVPSQYTVSFINASQLQVLTALYLHFCSKVDAFFAACPSNSPLNTASMVSTEQKNKLAGELFNSGLHKTLPEDEDAWRSSCFAVRKEAHATATTSAASLKSAYPQGCSSGGLPYIPDVSAVEDNVEMTLYGLAFVYIKRSDSGPRRKFMSYYPRLNWLLMQISYTTL